MILTLLYPLMLNATTLTVPTQPQLNTKQVALLAENLLPPSAPVGVSVTEAPDVVVVRQPVYHPPIPVSTLTFQTMPWPWGCIAWHESTWNLAAINPSSGDAGAFQISQYMWEQYRSQSDPWWIPAATLTQQYHVALRIEQAWGWGQWETAPLCGE